MLNKPKR